MASAFEEKLLAAEQTNLKAAKYWGVGIAGLIGIFIIEHWTGKLLRGNVSKVNPFGKVISTVSAPFHRLLLGNTIGRILILPGRIWLALAYLAINIACAFTDVNWTIAELFFAKRMGWMTVCNLCLVIFLGMKNTALSPLAGRSYESLNVLHQFVGYTTILCMVLHSTIHIAGLFKYNSVYILRNTHQYGAMTAGISMLVILLSILIRQRQYELFYVIHIVFAVVILITATYHTYHPGMISTQVLGVTILAISLFLVDRILRASRWLYYGIGNYATLTALPEGATRVTLQRALPAAPGSHAFLYMPGVRAFETHPFSLFSTKPVEFVINARDGFTRSLHQTALTSGGKKFRASVEGPYGQPPAVLTFDRVMIIAGGSGATFCLSLALAWVRQPERRKPGSSLTFVWAIKNRSYLEWFGAELAELQSCSSVQLLIHATRSQQGTIQVADNIADEKSKELDSKQVDARRSSSSDSSSLDRSVEYGRPDIGGIINDAMRGLSVEKTTLVAVAGPEGLMTDAHLAVAKRIRADRPSIHLHLEQFGW